VLVIRQTKDLTIISRVGRILRAIQISERQLRVERGFSYQWLMINGEWLIINDEVSKLAKDTKVRSNLTSDRTFGIKEYALP